MSESARVLVKENRDILNSINKIIELFKMDKELTSLKKNYEIMEKRFFIGFERSRKYADCLNIRFDDIGNLSKNNDDFFYLSFENVPYKDILKKLLFVLVNVYELKDLKLNLNAKDDEKKESEKTFY